MFFGGGAIITSIYEIINGYKPIIIGTLLILGMTILFVSDLDKNISKKDVPDSEALKIENIDGELYNITENAVTPYENVLNRGETVYILNSRSESIEVHLESSEVYKVSSKSYKTFEAKYIQYFEVKIDDEVIGKGKINVQ